MKLLNVMIVLVDIFISLSKVFNGLKEVKGWFFVVFILFVGIFVVSMFVFYNKVDL